MKTGRCGGRRGPTSSAGIPGTATCGPGATRSRAGPRRSCATSSPSGCSGCRPTSGWTRTCHGRTCHGERADGRGAAWTEERATREDGASRAPRRRAGGTVSTTTGPATTGSSSTGSSTTGSSTTGTASTGLSTTGTPPASAGGTSSGPASGMPDLLYGEAEPELRAAVRALFDDRSGWRDVLARTETPETYDSGLWQALAADVGCAGLLIPEGQGGAGASYREAAVVAEESGRAVAPVPYLGSAVVATTALLAAGGDQLLTALAGGTVTA